MLPLTTKLIPTILFLFAFLLSPHSAVAQMEEQPKSAQSFQIVTDQNITLDDLQKQSYRPQPDVVATYNLTSFCRERMFTDRGTKYCIQQAYDEELEKLQRANSTAYLSLKEKEKAPLALKEARHLMATEDLIFKSDMDTSCFNKIKSIQNDFDIEITDMVCRIDAIKKYRDQLQSR